MEESRYFARLSVFALLIGAVYWFLSYEAAGTALLVGFGVATGGWFLWLWLSARGRHGSPSGEPERDSGAGPVPASTAPDGPFGDESGPVPTGSGAPLALALGVALMALAGAFGPWFLAAGVIPLLIGAASWLGAADRELAIRERLDRRAVDPPPTPARKADASLRRP